MLFRVFYQSDNISISIKTVAITYRILIWAYDIRLRIFFVESVYNLVNVLNERSCTCQDTRRRAVVLREAHNFIISLNVQKSTDEIARGNLSHYARYTRETAGRKNPIVIRTTQHDYTTIASLIFRNWYPRTAYNLLLPLIRGLPLTEFLSLEYPTIFKSSHTKLSDDDKGRLLLHTCA